METLSDLELLRAAAAGNHAAFERLVDRHAAGLFRAAISLTRSRDDAEDVMQEAMIGAFRGVKKFNGRSSVKTWLTSILIRQAAKGWHRNRHQRQTLSIHATVRESDSHDVRSLHVGSSSENADRRMDLMAMLKTMSADHQQVIVMREIQGLSYDEIAMALNVPRGTVESRLHRAREQLREKLGAAYQP